MNFAGSPLALAGAALLTLVSGVQTAHAAAPELTSVGGLLVLPNVRVETSARPLAATPASSRDAGMKAYKDHETGALRKQNPEEAIEENTTPVGANDAAGASVTIGANGRKSAVLDESFMSYSVARKGRDGRLDVQCVTGEAQATVALKGRPVAKEQRHAH